MEQYKASIIITAFKKNEEKLRSVKRDWGNQIDSMNDISIDDNYDHDTYQIGIHFGPEAKIPEIRIPSIDIDGIITMSIIEATPISAIILRDKILKQIGQAKCVISKCNYDDTYILSFCFENGLPSFTVYDKN